jgi:hypothetical protein
MINYNKNPMYGGYNNNLYELDPEEEMQQKQGINPAALVGGAGFVAGQVTDIAALKNDDVNQYTTQVDMSNPYANPGMYQAAENPYKKGVGGKAALSGAASGAAAGAALGPLGALAGAGVGAISGIIKGSVNAKKRQEFEKAEAVAKQNFMNQQRMYKNNVMNTENKANMNNYYDRRYQNAFNVPSYGQAYYSI